MRTGGRIRTGLVGAAVVAMITAAACVPGAGSAPNPYPLSLGRAYDRLPPEVRSAFDARLRAAFEPRLGSASTHDEVNALYQAMLVRGYGRLDDSRLVLFLRLRTAALDAVDPASCAAYGRLDRDGFLGSDASQRMDEALPADQYEQFAGIQVDAVEAEAVAERPDASLSPLGVGSVPEAVMSPIFERVFAGLDPSTAKRAAAVLGSNDTSDAAVCSTWRAIYHGALALDAQALAIYARGDVVPPATP